MTAADLVDYVSSQRRGPSVSDRTIPVLETERLILRPLRKDDRLAFFEIFSDQQTLKYWSGDVIETLQEAGDLVDQELQWAASGHCINWGIELRDGGPLIGKIVLFNFSDQNRRAEIGYILARRQWGRAYMTETLAEVLNYAFQELKLHRIEADTDPENLASLALLKRFGFSREGLFRDRWWVQGKWHDSVMLGLLASEFRV
jgi:RimJ/RimL family protein N-acetyltransferase